jgi:hypothetical protein
VALDWQLFPISLTQGVDTKTDERQVIPGRLLTLENGVFDSPGKIQKRHGLTTLSRSIEGGDSLASGSALATRGDELLMFSGGKAYSWLPSTERWNPVGDAESVLTRTRRVIENHAAQSSPDVAHHDGVELYAWEDSRGGVRGSVHDTANQSPILQDQVVTFTGRQPRCVAFEGALLALFGDGNTVKYRRIDATVPRVLEVERVLVTDHAESTSSSFDAIVVSSSLYLAYTTTGAGVTLRRYDSTFTELSSVALTGSHGPVALWSDPSSNVWSATVNGGDVMGHVHTIALSSVMTGTHVEASVGTVRNLAGVCVSGSLSSVYYELTGSRSMDSFVKVAPLDTTATVTVVSGTVYSTAGSPVVFKRSVGLASKAWRQGDSHYVWLTHDAPKQPTYFAANANGTIVSKANPSLGGGLRSKRTLSNVAQLADGSRLAAFQRKGTLLSSGSLFSQPGITATTLSFDDDDGFSYVTAGDQLHLAGGVVSNYDGVSFTEHGFHLYPEELTGTFGGAGSMDAGEYQYMAVYAWRDNLGRVHRSAPSYELTVNVGSSSGSVLLSVPTLRLTSKDQRGAPVSVELYRNERDGGGIFHLVTSPTQPLLASSSLDAVTYTDTVSDSDLVSRALLYTDGGFLENDPPPASTLCETYRNRLWLAGLEDPNLIRYSKPRRTHEAFAFSDFYDLTVDARGGDVVALRAMDDFLVVFKPRAIHVVAGEGLDVFGGGQDPEQRLITSDVGCVNPNTVVMTDKGLFFLSSKGIYLLDRSLAVQPIGFPAEGLVEGSTITSATLVGGKNHVRFTTSDGGAVVYDYAFDQWGEFTYPAAVDSVDWDGTYALLRSDGRVALEDDDTFTDDGSLVALDLSTGWIALSGVQGFQAVRRIHVLGEYRGAGRLTYELAYDGNPAAVESGTIDVESIVDSATYGEGSYGVDEYGGAFPLYQFQIQPKRHRCNSVKITLRDASPLSGSATEALSLGHVTLEVGSLRGGTRLSGRRRVAT